MHRIFKREQIVTVPNLLSAIRLLLIPLIVWLYCDKQDYHAAVAVLIISGLTDILDGFIARHCGMVSDFGKILDPIADKLTQATVFICLAFQYPFMIALVISLTIKELCMGVVGYLAIRKHDSVNSAKWYGKVNTVILYTIMLVLILFPRITDAIANCLITVGIGTLVLSLILYIRFYINLFSEEHKKR